MITLTIILCVANVGELRTTCIRDNITVPTSLAEYSVTSYCESARRMAEHADELIVRSCALEIRKVNNG